MWKKTVIQLELKLNRSKIKIDKFKLELTELRTLKKTNQAELKAAKLKKREAKASIKAKPERVYSIKK